MIITSLLDSDLYKWGMCFALRETCKRMKIEIPHAQYKFKCRNEKDLIPYKKEIEKEIKAFQELKFTMSDIDYLMSLGYFNASFSNHLHDVDLKTVSVNVYEFGGELHIDIEGRMDVAIFFEVPLLAIVNEVYFKHQKVCKKKAVENLTKFVKEMHGDGELFSSNSITRFADFGTRRRFSKKWQAKCIAEAQSAGILTGTSNVMYAKMFNIKPVGTMAHEWLQLFQAITPNLRDFQKEAFNQWMLTYRGKLDTALTDILGIDAFLRDWDEMFMKNFSTLRHDSGSPFAFCVKVMKKYIAHRKYDYECANVNLLFSDGLTPKLCKEIKEYIDPIRSVTSSANDGKFRARCLFGIGTYFTNNCGVEPLQIVIKLAKVNGQEVLKISDSVGKAMTTDSQLSYKLTEVFNLKKGK